MENNDEKENIENEEEEELENIKMEKLDDFQSNQNYIFRICLLGDSNVGKTSLLTRFCDSTFKESYNNTIGVDFRVMTLKYKDIIVKVHIWDTAGQERFKSIAINYFRSTHGFIFVYDITDEDSFSNIENWINLAFNNSSTHIINFLVGNKCDLEEERKVKKEEAENYAKTKDLFFFEASAKNNDNVEKVFEYFTYKLIKHFKKNKDAMDDNNDPNKISMNNFEQVQSDTKKEDKCNC